MVVVAHPDFLPRETELVNLLFAEGLEVFHLRKPHCSHSQMIHFLNEINAEFHPRIMIHSHYDLLEEFNLKGCHFTEKSKGDFLLYRANMAYKSWAVHQLPELDVIPEEVDSVILSPIFPSISKEGYSNSWSMGELEKELSRNRHFRRVALGGIDEQTIRKAYDMGFDDVALLGCVWGPFKRDLSVQNTLQTFKTLMKCAKNDSFV